MGQIRAGQPEGAVRMLGAVLAELDRLDGPARAEGEATPTGSEDRGRPADRLVLRVNTLVSMATADFLLRGRDAALDCLDRAQQLVESAAPADLDGDLDGDLDRGALLARIAYQRANVHGRAGDLALADEQFQRVRARFDAFTDRERCAVQLSRGMIALSRSRHEEAMEAFADAAAIARELGSVEQEFMARHNGGYSAYLLGDLPRALSEMAEADRIQTDVPRATARLDLGTVLLEAGLASEAVDVLQSGAAACTRRSEAQIRADYHLELARALLVLGRLDSALVAARRARATYRRVGARGWEARARLMELKVVVERLQLLVQASPGAGVQAPARRAARACALLARLAEELGDGELAARACTLSASALVLMGDIESARALVLGGAGRAHGSLAEELNRLSVVASVLVASGERSRARSTLSRAARTLAAGQRGSASIDLRTARALLGVRLGALDLDLARQRGSGAVLESLERWRSASDRLPLVRRSPDPSLADLVEQLRSLHAAMREPGSGADLAALQKRATRLGREVRARDWTLSNHGDLATDVSVRVRDARQLLATLDLDLVWFFSQGGRLCALGIVGGRATVKDLMSLDAADSLSSRLRADLRVAATRRLGPLEYAVWGSLRSTAARLDEALLAPWGLGGRGVVVVACEQVSALPWALLPTLREVPLTLARSLTAFARRSGVDTDRRGVPVHVSVGPDIVRGLAEADAVTSAWAVAGAVSQAGRSTRQGLVAALAAPGVVHVAAHGIHEPESPLFSSLMLHDGPIFAHELQPSGVAADHVVLSACDVGSVAYRPGDESLGMAASMLSLGARSVVAAVSPVPDEVAEDVVTRHHRGLARGLASDEALAAAIAASEPVAASFLNLGSRW